MLHMVMARIAAIILLFSACAVFAQTPALSTLTVVVTDQSGANVPGAHIKATAKANGERFEAIADARGKAVIQLCQGSYELTVQSEGFKTWDEKEVKVNVETQRSVILLIGDGCTICVIPDVLDIPLENGVLAEMIPLIPMQIFIPPAKPRHNKLLWF
jgi:hypothetical protein